MQSQFDVSILGLRNIVQEFDGFILALLSYKDEVEKEGNHLSTAGFEDIKAHIAALQKEQESNVSMIGSYRSSLVSIADFYEQTEKKLLGESDSEKKEETKTEEKDEQNWFEKFFNGLGDSMKQDLFSSMLQSGGDTFVKLAGAINRWTALASNPGQNGFIMLDPSVAGTTSSMAKLGTCFSKYGVPLIGGIIDFGGQLGSGEGTGHAALKAGIHTAVGIGVGVGVNAATGAALGAMFGSAVPVVGTVAGAVVGFAVGSVITFAANKGVDYVYDHYLKDPINKAYDAVKDTASHVVDKVGDTLDDVGDAVSGFFGDIGSTIFG